MPSFTLFHSPCRAAAALLFICCALPAAAQPLTKEARRCVKAVDKGTAALAKAQGSIGLDCFKQAAAGDLGAVPTVEACLAGDAKGRLAKGRELALSAEALRCSAPQLPGFGVPELSGPYLPASPVLFDPNVHEMYAETTLVAVPKATTLVLRDVFGDPLDAGALLSATNAAGAACQKRVAKAVTKCAGAQRKAVLSCKKKSLANGAVDAAALETTCMETNGNPASGLPDPKGKLAKACATAIGAVLTESCAGQVPAALPGACASAVDTAACVVDQIDCRVCQETNTASGLQRDCDLLDDGLDNASCGNTVPQCGNDIFDSPSEQCDDGNLVDGDCCSSTCQLEVTPCPAPSVVIDSPSHGSFTQAAQVIVSGHVAAINVNDAALTINGVPVPLQQDKTFSTTLSPSAAQIFNPAFAHLTRQHDGAVAADRIVIIAGASLPAADGAPQGLALRLNDSAFDAIEPTLSSLIPPIDLSGFLVPGTVLLNDVCYLPIGSSCLGSIDLAIGSTPPPGIDGIAFNVDSQLNTVAVSITIENLVLPLTVTSVTGAALNCDIELHAPATILAGSYDLSPLISDPTNIDVTQIGDIAVTTPGLTSTTTCAGGLGVLINGLVGPLFSQLLGTLGAPLNTVDGNGNTPIASALETTFSAIDLGSVLGTGLGLSVQAPYAAINETTIGISFAADLAASALTPAPGAPTLPAYLHVPETFPAFTASTPVGAAPFDVAIGLSTSAMNALLRAQTEQGLLQLATTSIDLGGGPTGLTAAALSAALPQFGALPPATPLTLRLVPTLAPILSGAGALSGVIAELRLGHLLFEIVENPGVGEIVHLGFALDARFDATLTASPAGLTYALTAPLPADITVGVLANPLGVNEATVATLAPAILTGLLPDLTSALGSIPVPTVLGTSLEVSRSPYYTAFAEFGSLL